MCLLREASASACNGEGAMFCTDGDKTSASCQARPCCTGGPDAAMGEDVSGGADCKANGSVSSACASRGLAEEYSGSQDDVAVDSGCLQSDDAADCGASGGVDVDLPNITEACFNLGVSCAADAGDCGPSNINAASPRVATCGMGESSGTLDTSILGINCRGTRVASSKLATRSEGDN